MRVAIALILLFSFFSGWSQQSERNWMVKGYVKDMQLFYHVDPTNEWTNQNLIHNRINFKWYPTTAFTVGIELRNRFYSGEMVRNFPGFGKFLDSDGGAWNLSSTLYNDNGMVLHSMIDRAYVDYAQGNWQIRLGRQRINWGMNLVWNPNDVFNTFSFLDFDYEERPGTDALLVQYFLGATSSLQLVYQFGDGIDQQALAGLLRFNKWDYDFQLLGGWVGEDWIIGTGWAGDIAGAGFRGEMTCFVPRNNGDNPVFVASISGDYSFASEVYIHGGVLFNSDGKKGRAGGQNLFVQDDLSPKSLSRGRMALFAQGAYPITPLWKADVSSIINPLDGSFYLGPSMSYSLLENLDAMLMSQLFFGQKDTEYGDLGQILYLRLKWSF